MELTTSSHTGWSFMLQAHDVGKSELTWLGSVRMFWMMYVVETVFKCRRWYNKS